MERAVNIPARPSGGLLVVFTSCRVSSNPPHRVISPMHFIIFWIGALELHGELLWRIEKCRNFRSCQ